METYPCWLLVWLDSKSSPSSILLRKLVNLPFVPTSSITIRESNVDEYVDDVIWDTSTSQFEVQLKTHEYANDDRVLKATRLYEASGYSIHGIDGPIYIHFFNGKYQGIKQPA